MVSRLFDLNLNDAHPLWKSYKAAKPGPGLVIKEALETLWERYAAYSDANFREKFAREPESHFWEMYLACCLLDEGKNLRKRTCLPAKSRDYGPDIVVMEGSKNVWFEAVTPKRGYTDDQVPEAVAKQNPSDMQWHCTPMRQVQLRITSALREKMEKFSEYKRNGMILDKDVCVVAINGAHFWKESMSRGFSPAARAVYPIGRLCITFSQQTGSIIDEYFQYDPEIERTNKVSISRMAFLDKQYSMISGMIWSRRTIGSFVSREHDLTYIHNVSGRNALPETWLDWCEEDVVRENEEKVTVSRTFPSKYS